VMVRVLVWSYMAKEWWASAGPAANPASAEAAIPEASKSFIDLNVTSTFSLWLADELACLAHVSSDVSAWAFVALWSVYTRVRSLGGNPSRRPREVQRQAPGGFHRARKTRPWCVPLEISWAAGRDGGDGGPSGKRPGAARAAARGCGLRPARSAA